MSSPTLDKYATKKTYAVGKTTTLRVLLGLVARTSGRATI